MPPQQQPCKRLMASPSPKIDGLRQMREAKFDKAQKAKTKAVEKPKAEKIAAAKQAVEIVNKQASVIKPVIKSVAGKSSAERQQKWREKNPDLNRKRARDGMRKQKAKE